ncbi:MAG: hypothetical protein AAF845_07080 [Bacteroidota bacterium]
MNLPTERLVLAFGAGIAVLAYGYWTVRELRLGEGLTGIASLRAGVVLGAMILLALVLRAVKAVNPGEDREE